MKKLIYGIIITIIFLEILNIIFNKLYSLNIVSGILEGPYIGFIIYKIYTTVLLLFCTYKIIRYRKIKDKQKEWLPLTIFAIISVTICFLFLNL